MVSISSYIGYKMQTHVLGANMCLLFNDVRREGRRRRGLETSVGIGVMGSKGRKQNCDGDNDAPHRAAEGKKSLPNHKSWKEVKMGHDV